MAKRKKKTATKKQATKNDLVELLTPEGGTIEVAPEVVESYLKVGYRKA